MTRAVRMEVGHVAPSRDPQLARQVRDLTRDGVTPSGAASTPLGRLRQVLCGLRGHDAVLHYEHRRMMMRCTSCGYDSPGWETAS
jgi:hypothetical protein